jgi:hypothetical protein
MHANRILSAVASALVLLSGMGCHSNQKEMIDIRGASYTLRPLSESKPVDLRSVRFEGYCDEATKGELAQFLGRIPAPVPIRSISVVWPECPLAARIEFGKGEYAFLVKERDQVWHLRGGVLIVNAGHGQQME